MLHVAMLPFFKHSNEALAWVFFLFLPDQIVPSFSSLSISHWKTLQFDLFLLTLCFPVLVLFLNSPILGYFYCGFFFLPYLFIFCYKCECTYNDISNFKANSFILLVRYGAIYLECFSLIDKHSGPFFSIPAKCLLRFL